MFLDGVIEYRTMCIGLTKIVRPGIDMGVEMNERERALAPRQRPQQGERDAVLSSKRHQVVDGGGLLLDDLQARRNITERDTKIADIRQHQFRNVDPRRRMRPVNQHPAGLANGLRSEARAAAVGGADIERDACDRDRRIALAAPESEKSGRDGKGGRIARHTVLLNRVGNFGWRAHTSDAALRSGKVGPFEAECFARLTN